MTIDPLALSQSLIRRPSITPKDEGAQAVLIDALRPMGFQCETLVFGEITNLFARRGTGTPHFCFCGHTDVVPPGDLAAWTHPPFEAVVEEGRLYGRGSADMKANIACFVAALSHFIEAGGGTRGSISLLITGDEEGPAVDGTVKVLEWMKATGHVPDVALVGEPSNPDALGDEIKIGRRGSLSGRLTVRGKQGHVAYPQRADNPLPRLVNLLSALTAHTFDKGTKFFPATNLEVTTIDVGNTADNVIPASGRAKFNIRFNDKWTAGTLAEAVRKILDKTGEAYEIEFSSNAESFITKPGPFTDLARGAIREVTGRDPKLTTVGGTSDARFVSRYCPVVELGLINRTIHQVDEHVVVDDLYKLTEIYRLMLERYFTP